MTATAQQEAPEIPALSPSIAHVLETESPLRAWSQHRLLGNNRRPSSDSQELGQIVHSLLLEDGARIAPMPFDDFKTKVARQARDLARVEGKVPIVEGKLAPLRTAAERIRERVLKLGYDLAHGRGERRVAWRQHTEHGWIVCHGQLDWIRNDRALVLDFKTTEGSAHPELCAAKLLRSAGVIQDEAYRKAVEFNSPGLEGRVEVVFLFAQIVEPYAVTPVRCGATMREIAVRRWHRAAETWAKCLKTNTWPSYTDGPVTVEAPAWALAREMEAW